MTNREPAGIPNWTIVIPADATRPLERAGFR
jgi:hypothetical protein